VSANRKNPWLRGIGIACLAFLALESVAAAFGWFVGMGFMHGRITGFDGAMIWAFIALYGAVPISLVAGGIAVARHWKS